MIKAWPEVTRWDGFEPCLTKGRSWIGFMERTRYLLYVWGTVGVKVKEIKRGKGTAARWPLQFNRAVLKREATWGSRSDSLSVEVLNGNGVSIPIELNLRVVCPERR